MSELLPPEPGSPIRVAFRKWDESPHWTSGDGAVYLGEDEYGWWFAHDEGVEYTRPDMAITIPALQIGYHSRDRWHAALIHTRHAQHEYRLYIDVTTPPEWRLNDAGLPELTAIDLDLDVIETMAGEIFLDDQEEFAEHTVAMRYPEDVVATALAEADLLLTEVRAGAPRFSDTMLMHWENEFRRLTPQ
ncbi:MAG: DUF402 domain-containing protein [Actinomycetia bacterium]|nr:DUF402 domain-containing protein [Actinomycetes bacterium]